MQLDSVNYYAVEYSFKASNKGEVSVHPGEVVGIIGRGTGDKFKVITGSGIIIIVVVTFI